MGTIRQNVEMMRTDGKYLKVKALIDTGASSPFITKKLARRLKLKEYTKDVAVLGDGTKVEVGLTSALIRIKGWRMSIKIGITDIDGDDMIIGVDFMQEHDYILTFRNDKLYVKKFDKKMAKLRM